MMTPELFQLYSSALSYSEWSREETREFGGQAIQRLELAARL
jgi:hypothetical protein